MITVLLSCLHFAMVTWRSNFMTHGWHFLHLFVCSSSRRAISDIHLSEEVWAYIPLAPRLLILTIWVNLPEFLHSACLGSARVGVAQEGGLQNSRWRRFHCHGNQTACGEGSRSGELGKGHRKTRYYVAVFIFKIGFGMEMSPMQTQLGED